jgi:hypothetical protein
MGFNSELKGLKVPFVHSFRIANTHHIYYSINTNQLMPCRKIIDAYSGNHYNMYKSWAVGRIFFIIVNLLVHTVTARFGGLNNLKDK